VIEEQQELPEGWEVKPLEKCAQILDSKRIPLNNSERSSRIEGLAKECLYPYLGATGQVGFIDDFIFEGEHLLLGEDGAPFFDKSRNVAFLWSGKFWVNNHAHILKACNEVTTNKYLLYFLNSFNYKGFVGGTTRLKLNQGNLKKIPVVLAPIVQQKQIVARIEELFSHIDAGIEGLKKAKALLKQYRQSVLKAAVTGELISKNFDIKVIHPVEYGIDSLGQGWSPRCEKEPAILSDDWGVIKTTAVQQLKFQAKENKRLPEHLEHRPKLEILDGDLLITRAGPRVRVGVCCLVRRPRKKLMICDKVYRARVNLERITPEYFEIVLNSPLIQDELEQLKTGINDSGVNLTQTKFLKLKIPFPALTEQKEIVQRVEEKLTAADRLMAELDTKLTQAQQQKQTILASAFKGELV